MLYEKRKQLLYVFAKKVTFCLSGTIGHVPSAFPAYDWQVKVALCIRYT